MNFYVRFVPEFFLYFKIGPRIPLVVRINCECIDVPRDGPYKLPNKKKELSSARAKEIGNLIITLVRKDP